MSFRTSLTGQLRLYSNGYEELGNSIFDEIFPRLRQIASWNLAKRKSRSGFTPTELVGETWLTRLRRGNWSIESREHFFGIAGKAMQQVLIDLARKEMAARRGCGAVHLSLDALSPRYEPAEADMEQLITIGMLIDKLETKDALTARIVRAHYLAGLELGEIAAESGLTPKQVRHRWDSGKIWLARQLL